MSQKLNNFNSIEGAVFKNCFELNGVNSIISLVIESFIYNEIKTFWENGQLQEHYFVKFETKFGEYRRYHENGNLHIKCAFTNEGHYEGEFIKWYENGQIEQQCHFNNGYFDGKYISFYEDGRKFEKATFANDEILYYKSWHPEGRKCSEFNSQRNRFLEWDSDGSLAYRDRKMPFNVSIQCF